MIVSKIHLFGNFESDFMEYSFKGTITSYKNHKIPFEVEEGRIRLNVSSIPSNEINHIDANGIEFFTGAPAFNQEFLEGITDNGKLIKIHIHSYYDGDHHFIYPNTSTHFIYGNISSCIVLDQEKFKEKIDKVGFYSFEINKITGQTVSGSFNEEHFKLFGIDRTLASYKERGNKYIVSYDFIEKKQYCGGQVLAVESDKPLSQEMIEDTFWTMRKLFAFIYQRKEIPLSDVVLFENDVVIGHAFIQKFVDDKQMLFGVKCLQIGFWKDKLSNLFQALVDRKIYLRHLPEYDDDKHKYTPSRYLSTVVGLENALNTLGVKANHSDNYKKAIETVRAELQKHIDESTGKVKQEYKRLLKSIKEERFVDKVLTALVDNKDYINNFFQSGRLGTNITQIAEDISKSRNHFAHGYLDEDLSTKHAEQCDFMDLFILYLQLLYIGFSQKDASEIVPFVLFGH